jgi:hypothetical protein
MGNSIWIYRLFDVAGEIDLDRVEEILANTRATSRVRLSRFPCRSIHFNNPPVVVELDRTQVKLGADTFAASFLGKVYDLGVVALVLKIELPVGEYEYIKQLSIFLETQGEENGGCPSILDIGIGSTNFASTHNSSVNKDTAHTSLEEKNIEDLFLAQLQSVCNILGPALIKPNQHFFVEDYKLFYFTDWQAEWDAVPILMGDAGPFSSQLREDALRYSLTYGPHDLTMITWDSAVVYDAAGSRDIPDILEFAICQLLELRYYDHLLNQEMTKMYDAIEEAQRFTPYRRYGQYRRIMKQMMELVMDLNEVTERIQNSLKVTGDVYYARVYRAALDAFRSKVWMESLERKITLIQQNYSLLNNEIVNERGALLEMAIVLLIVLEIILGLLQLM